MELYFTIASVGVALVALIYTVHFRTRREQTTYRDKIEHRLDVVEVNKDIVDLKLVQLDKEQGKFETRIEAQLNGLQLSFKQLNDLIIEKFLK